jgi:hypothetical protein
MVATVMARKTDPVRRRITCTVVALAVSYAMLDIASAQGNYYPLIVNGSTSLQASYDSGYLVVRFRKSRNAAGKPSNYTKLAPGSAAWVDRPLNPNEPTMLKQRMTEQQATAAIDRLRQNGGFWRFYCRFNPAGYFDVSRSEAAYASVRID